MSLSKGWKTLEETLVCSYAVHLRRDGCFVFYTDALSGLQGGKFTYQPRFLAYNSSGGILWTLGKQPCGLGRRIFESDT